MARIDQQLITLELDKLVALLEKAEKLIGKGRVDRAIDSLRAYDEHIDPDDDLLDMARRWNEVEREYLQNMMTRSEANVEKAKISRLLIQFLKNLENHAKKEKERLNAAAEAVPLVTDDALNDALASQDITSVGTDAAADLKLEKIIGRGGNFVKVQWLMNMVEAARSVCRITTRETENGVENTYFGTGFLIEGGWLLTNHHVFHHQDVVRTAKVEFGYTGNSGGVTYQLDADSWRSDPNLDVAQVKIIDNPQQPVSKWGVLKMNADYVIQKGTPLNIIQHPDGRSQEVVFTDNRTLSVTDTVVNYVTNTEGGSSGSPVFNQDWEVVALHRGARANMNANVGTPIKAVLQFVETPAPPPADPTPAPSPAGGSAITPPPSTPESTPAKVPGPAAGKHRVVLLYDQTNSDLRDKLDKYLFAVKRNPKIELVDIQKGLLGGSNTLAYQKGIVASAEVVLCIVTFNVLVPPIYELAEHAKNNGTTLIPLFFTKVPLQNTVFDGLRGLPSNNQFVSEWPNEESALTDIATELMKFFQTLWG